MTAESNSIVRAGELLSNLRTQIGNALVGQNEVVDQIIIALIVSGHVLIEGVPGLGKTLLVRALAGEPRQQAGYHGKVQFTPDLMPSDITDHAVLDNTTRTLRIVQDPGIRQCAAGRRDQSRARQDPKRLARSHAGSIK